jgi:ketosteroid isomerase-like protein
MSDSGAKQRGEAPIARRDAGGGDVGEDNVAVIRAALEAFQRGNMEVFLTFVDPQIEVFSSPEMANPIDDVGRDKWLVWIAEWYGAWQTFEVEAEEMEPVGARHVVVRMLQRGIGKGSGVEVELRVFYMFEVRDGVAVRYHLYPDREQALAAAEAGERG